MLGERAREVQLCCSHHRGKARRKKGILDRPMTRESGVLRSFFHRYPLPRNSISTLHPSPAPLPEKTTFQQQGVLSRVW